VLAGRDHWMGDIGRQPLSRGAAHWSAHCGNEAGPVRHL